MFPSLSSLRASSIAEEASQNLLLLHHFLHETPDRLCFTPEQIPIRHNRQLNDPSDGKSFLIPFMCSSLNVLASMTKRLDTVTTQLATVQSIVATLPTSSALDTRLSPINTSLRDLSQRISAAPPGPLGPTSAHYAPDRCGYTSCGPPSHPQTSCPPPEGHQQQHGLRLRHPLL